MIKLPKGITLHSAANGGGGVTIYLKKSTKRFIIDALFHGELSSFVLDVFGAPVCFNKLDDIRYKYESYYRKPDKHGIYQSDDVTFEVGLPLLALIAKNYKPCELVTVKVRDGYMRGDSIGKISLQSALRTIKAGQAKY